MDLRSRDNEGLDRAAVASILCERVRSAALLAHGSSHYPAIGGKTSQNLDALVSSSFLLQNTAFVGSEFRQSGGAVLLSLFSFQRLFELFFVGLLMIAPPHLKLQA